MSSLSVVVRWLAGGLPPPSRGGSARLGGTLLGVLDATVVDADERLDQALADLADLAEGQPALVELAVSQSLLDEVADQALDPCGGGLREGPAGALDRVGDHQDAGLLRLRLGARVAEGALLDRRRVGVAVVAAV